MLKVVLIDDERLARDELRRLLSRSRVNCHIVAEAASIEQGLEAVANHPADLILLDIQLPDGTGFDLLAALDRVPPVIFTSAYDHYALRAFAVNALDYLLKPIEPERLEQALQKVTPAAPASSGEPTAAQEKIFLQEGERCWFVALDQITLFESEGNYTRVYFEQHRPLMLRSLSQLEARLHPSQFIRINRSQIVNLRSVSQITTAPTGGLTLVLHNQMRLQMSRRRSSAFKQEHQL
ncbi:response regulator [Duganella sp. FT80W]|uniref:Response regulator n=1 Tax=Duganella guangzhouensis TaxID=2666084 RepID=A0A6I2L9E1_9BURK|nr:LytTR family DNA-binding domain-containing protein [Duganella guangzhouensis]MRW93306.1 response regulator [Duganella guangzhouensis]